MSEVPVSTQMEGSTFLDASVAFGSGYICIAGPPASGKTSLVVHYLTQRSRERFPRAKRGRCAARDGEAPGTRPSFKLAYLTACSLHGDALARFVRTLESRAVGRRGSESCSLHRFGYAVRQYLSQQAAGSELHLVLDGADELIDHSEAVDLWLAACRPIPENRVVVIWVLSQLPQRIPDCFRYHFLAPSSAERTCAWLRLQYTVLAGHDAEAKEERHHGHPAVVRGAADSAPRSALEKQHLATVDAVAYFMSRRPMSASVVARDPRLLLTRVHAMLPLLEPHYTTNSKGAGGAKGAASALQLATAWSQFNVATNQKEATVGETTASEKDVLFFALQQLGCSAMLLALSCFYCGAVPKTRFASVFGDAAGNLRARRPRRPAHSLATRKEVSHTASVLTGTAHVVRVPLLEFLYSALLRICVNAMDPLEFAPATVALHHRQVLVALGVLARIGGHEKEAYVCHLPLTTALSLAAALSLSLYDLIPNH